MTTKGAWLTACLLATAWGCTGTSGSNAGTEPPPRADEAVVLDPAAPGPAFGNLFRAVNLDTNKQMADAADYDRLERLMCPDPSGCVPGAVRYWDKVAYGRHALEEPVSNRKVLEELHTRGFEVTWTIWGTPAFLSPSCSGGCVVETDEATYHLLRPVRMDATDPRNPTGVDVSCTCEDGWQYDVPVTGAVGGVDALDYIERTVRDGLALFEGGDARLRVALWNEPDTPGWWRGNQQQFVATWCRMIGRLREVVGDRDDVLLGGPDVSNPFGSISAAANPLLEDIQTTCGDGRYDFLAYHHYREPARLLFEESVRTVRSWGSDPSLGIDVGEYAAALSVAEEKPAVCDPTAVALAQGETPTAQGDPKGLLCDHRGAVEEVAMAASMAAQDHGRLYRFEVWDWGATDMVESRMGLLTVNNLPKPTATAFWMLSHLQGARVAVVNRLDGAHPFHLLAARQDDTITVVVAAQDRTVTQQFTRGLLTRGLVFAKDVAPELARVNCEVFSSGDPEATLSELAASGTSAEQLVELCPALDDGLAEDLAAALAYAAPRVGQVGEPFTLAIEAEGLDGPLSLHRIDAWHNTYAETLRRWPDAEYAGASFDFEAAEQALWEYLTTPIDEVEAAGGRLVIEVPPDSVTMLRGRLVNR